MSDSYILIGFASAFSLTTYFYYYKTKAFNIGVLLLMFYSICAWGAVAFHEHELFYMEYGYQGYSVKAFIYLYLVIILFMLPILIYKTNEIKRAELLDNSFTLKFIKVLLIIQLALYVIIFPYVFNAIASSSIGDYRDELYDTTEVVKFPNYFFNMLCRLYMGARNVLIIIACYSLLFIKTNRKLIITFFITTWLFPIYIFTVYASRAVMMQQLMLSFFFIVLLSPFILRKAKKIIYMVLGIVTVPIIVIFNIISQSRFGNLATYYLYRYWGESFNNYNAQLFPDLKGNTWGSAYLTFFSKLFYGTRNFSTTEEKWAYLDNVTGIDTHIFYSFVGGLNIEFGFILTVVIGIFLSLFIIKKLRPYDTLTLPKFILLGMLGYTLINGAFFFVLQGDWGNLEILFTIFLYWLFKKHSTHKYIYRKV